MSIELRDKRRMRNLRNKLGRFTKDIELKPLEIMLEEAPRIEEESKAQAPYDPTNDGDHMRDNIVCTVQREKKTIAVLTLSVFAKSAHDGYDYSNIQNEDETLNHPSLKNQALGYTTGGKAHFMDDPFFEGSDRISKRIEQEVTYDRRST